MGVQQCDLSSQKYGFDLVVAVTQRSVNNTLKHLMASLDEPLVTICYVYNDQGDLVPSEFNELKAKAGGTDPFTIPNGADPFKEAGLVKLTDANFAGAIRAKLGLPNVSLDKLPPIVTFETNMHATVNFNLLCAEFDIVGFQYNGPRKATWINMSQPTGNQSPWYFSAHVVLDDKKVDLESGQIPETVETRARELQKDDHTFTIQKLFLDLDTAMATSRPTVVGIPTGWAVWQLVSTIFLSAYFKQLGQSGNPVLAYNFVLETPLPSSLTLGAVSRQCQGFVGGDGTPTPQKQDASTLVYIGSQSTVQPIPVPFSWNWLDLNEVTTMSGVQAVRRDVFFGFFANLISRFTDPLSFVPRIDMKEEGGGFSVKYGYRMGQGAAKFEKVSKIDKPDDDGFASVLSLSWSKPSSGNAKTEPLQEEEIWGDFNYTLTGSVAVKGNQIRLRMRAQVYLCFKHRELFVTYTDLDGKTYYDKTVTETYTLAVDSRGHLVVDRAFDSKDVGKKLTFDQKGIYGLIDHLNAIKEGFEEISTALNKRIDDGFESIKGHLAEEINGYKGWVFPGNDAFVFKHVKFSDSLDLTAQLTYASVS